LVPHALQAAAVVGAAWPEHVAAAPELEAPELEAPELEAPELEAPELEAPELDELEEDAPPSLLEAAPELAPVAAEPEGAGDAVVEGSGRVGTWTVESSPGPVPTAQANRASAADAPTTSETTEKRRATTTGE
jgi:hypothetical protein